MTPKKGTTTRSKKINTIGQASAAIREKHPRTVKMNDGTIVTVRELKHRELRPLLELVTGAFLTYEQGQVTNGNLMEIILMQQKAGAELGNAETLAESLEGMTQNMVRKAAELPDTTAEMIASCTGMEIDTVNDLAISDSLRLMRAVLTINITENEEIIHFFGDLMSAIQSLGTVAAGGLQVAPAANPGNVKTPAA